MNGELDDFRRFLFDQTKNLGPLFYRYDWIYQTGRGQFPLAHQADNGLIRAMLVPAGIIARWMAPTTTVGNNNRQSVVMYFTPKPQTTGFPLIETGPTNRPCDAGGPISCLQAGIASRNFDGNINPGATGQFMNFEGGIASGGVEHLAGSMKSGPLAALGKRIHRDNLLGPGLGEHPYGQETNRAKPDHGYFVTVTDLRFSYTMKGNISRLRAKDQLGIEISERPEIVFMTDVSLADIHMTEDTIAHSPASDFGTDLLDDADTSSTSALWFACFRSGGVVFDKKTHFLVEALTGPVDAFETGDGSAMLAGGDFGLYQHLALPQRTVLILKNFQLVRSSDSQTTRHYHPPFRARIRFILPLDKSCHPWYFCKRLRSVNWRKQQLSAFLVRCLLSVPFREKSILTAESDKQPTRRHLRAGRASSGVTIKDVAEAAGVSTATVSRVYSDPKGRVSSATRRRVLRAAQDLGYKPHRGARALARQRSDLIGVLLVGFGEGFVGEVMDGIAEAARPLGRETVFACYGRRGYDGLRNALDHLLEMRAEGIIFYPLNSLPIDDKQLVADLKQAPTVLVDMAVEGLDLPLVTSDDAAGIKQAVDHLVSLGHERIAHLAGPSWTSTGATRLRAFKEAMAENGLQVPPELIVPHDFTYSRSVIAAQRLLQASPLPTAVVAVDDKSAAALLEVARHSGLRVPDDLSIIGYSDILLCQTWQPPLTTVRQPKAELGKEAVQVLSALINGDETIAPGSVHLLPTQLVVRGSCGRRAAQWTSPVPLTPNPDLAKTEGVEKVDLGLKEAPMQ